MPEWALMALVMPILTVLSVKDWRHRTLPNRWTLALALVAFVVRLAFGGISGVVDGALGGFLCAAFLLVPFLLRGAGAGDVKMMFGAGIAAGLRLCVAEMLFVSICGLLLGLAMLAAGRTGFGRKAAARGVAFQVPFGVAIAVGTVMTLGYALWLGGRP